MSGYSYLNARSVQIDNVVVTPLSEGGIRLTKVDRLKKMGLNLSQVPTRSFGSRLLNNKILSDLACGTFPFERL